MPLRDDITARAGATFGPRGWPILDAHGAPLRDPDGVEVRAQVRDRPRGEIRHEFRSTGDTPNLTVGLILLSGDPVPQVVALLTATAEQTATWEWRCLPYDVLVAYQGRVDEVVHGDFTVHHGITR